MRRRNLKLVILLIFFLGFIAGNFVQPMYWNQYADNINAKKNEISYIEKLPNIPQFPAGFKLGLDLQGGTHLVYEADMSMIGDRSPEAALQGLRDVIERRVNLFGVSEPIVQTQQTPGKNRLIVELAGVTDPALAIEMIGQTPLLEFKELLSPEERDGFNEQRNIFLNQLKEENILSDDFDVENYSSDLFCRNEFFLELYILTYVQDPCFKNTELTGRYLDSAKMGFNQSAQSFQEPIISLEFDKEGSDIFAQLTEENIGKPLAIYLDGRPISMPNVETRISGGSAQISGGFTTKEAKELASNLSAGALPVPINLISQQTIGPTLGADSLNKSLQAGIVGFLVILIFIIIFYRLPGVLASIALLIYVFLMLSIIKVFGITLTLAGIGGFILSIGMAIDANILIFSRFREELRDEKSFTESVAQGFNRAWPAIRDGNLTTLLVAGILFIFGVGFVKGFALTLGIGILLSMFSAIFITKHFLEIFESTRWENWKRLWR